MPLASVIQLRELLSGKFPGLRTQLDPDPPPFAKYWRTGLMPIDAPLSGGLPKGAFTEVVADKLSSGSASLGRALLQRAAAEGQIVALVDGTDSFEVTQLEEADLTRLLWVRCRSGEEALKAADLLLRDGNLYLLLLDLLEVAERELRRIPPTTWYRFQRLLETTATVCVAFVPRPMISPAEVRLTLHSRFGLAALEQPTEQLLQPLPMEVLAVKSSHETARRNCA